MTRRIIRRKPPPKVKTENKWVCPSCLGVLHSMRRVSLEQVKEVHADTCPAALRVRKK